MCKGDEPWKGDLEALLNRRNTVVVGVELGTFNLSQFLHTMNVCNAVGMNDDVRTQRE